MGAWIEVFKTGTHISGNGVTKTYTEDDLDNIVKLYNEQTDHEAPLVLGHPTTDSPAYGWGKKLKRVGAKMLAYVDQVADSIVEAVSKGEYKKVSIALYPDGLLRHIGLLGAVPPAVKGLASVQFAEGLEFDEYIWVTDETRMPTVARILSSIRDFLIEKHGIETTDKIIDKDDIAYLNRPAQENMITVKDKKEDTALNPNYSEQEVSDMEKAQLEEFEKGLLAKVQTMVTESMTSFSETVGKQITNLTTLVTGHVETAANNAKTAAIETSKTAFAAFCETLCKEGKMLPAEKDGIVLEYADLLVAEQTMTFAEADVRPSDKMKKRLESRPVMFKPGMTFADPNKKMKTAGTEVPVEFAELSDRISPDSIDQDAQIMAYAEEHKCSYEDAAAKYARATF